MYERNVPQHSYPLNIPTVLGLDLKMNLRKIESTNLRLRLRQILGDHRRTNKTLT